MARARTLWMLPCLLLAAAAWAAAPDDFAAGRDAWRHGDVRSAISFLRKSADQGHAPSQALLAELLDHAEQNEEAVRYFGLAAAQGDAAGFYGLAVMQGAGEGTPRDLGAARRSMQRAAELGHPTAINTMALSYMRGGFDLPREATGSPEALRWIRAAAANDHLESVDRLAAAYRKGELGLALDVRKAEEYEARAKALRGTRSVKITRKAKPNG